MINSSLDVVEIFLVILTLLVVIDLRITALFWFSGTVSIGYNNVRFLKIFRFGGTRNSTDLLDLLKIKFFFFFFFSFRDWRDSQGTYNACPSQIPNASGNVDF